MIIINTSYKFLRLQPQVDRRPSEAMHENPAIQHRKYITQIHEVKGRYLSKRLHNTYIKNHVLDDLSKHKNNMNFNHWNLKTRPQIRQKLYP